MVAAASISWRWRFTSTLAVAILVENGQSATVLYKGRELLVHGFSENPDIWTRLRTLARKVDPLIFSQPETVKQRLEEPFTYIIQKSYTVNNKLKDGHIFI